MSYSKKFIFSLFSFLEIYFCTSNIYKKKSVRLLIGVIQMMIQVCAAFPSLLHITNKITETGSHHAGMAGFLKHLKMLSLESFHTFTVYHLILSFANKILFSTFPSLSGLQPHKRKIGTTLSGTALPHVPKAACVAVRAAALLETELLV